MPLKMDLENVLKNAIKTPPESGALVALVMLQSF